MNDLSSCSSFLKRFVIHLLSRGGPAPTFKTTYRIVVMCKMSTLQECVQNEHNRLTRDGTGWDGRTCLARPNNSQARTGTGEKHIIFPVRLTTTRVGLATIPGWSRLCYKSIDATIHAQHITCTTSSIRIDFPARESWYVVSIWIF